MVFNPEKHHRRSIRLRGYDYSQNGAYFITLCTRNRECVFGAIVNGRMVLNDAGRVADKCWGHIPSHFPQIRLDAFAVMPNHVHGILFMDDDAGTMGFGAVGVGAKNFSPLPLGQPPRGTSRTIGSVVRGFKIGVTKWMRSHTHVHDVWQRNYWERVIRNEGELNHFRKYIRDNPARWADDPLHEDNMNPG